MPNINVSKLNGNKTSLLLKNSDCICLYHWKHCGHCISLLPLWKKFSKKYSSKLNIISIELDNIKEIDNKFTKNIMAFPSIIIYINGKKFSEFKEQRTMDNLENFIKPILPSSKKTIK